MGAIFSEPDRVYRYRLTRRIGPIRSSDHDAVTFIMLNPSTATDVHNDPTITRCISFARSWKCANLIVMNLYAYRSRDPERLWHVRDPVGPENDHYLRYALRQAGRAGHPRLTIAAWGAKAKQDRVDQVLSFPGAENLMVLGVTVHRQPRHPLFMPTDSVPLPWVR